ncbi:DMT family transporter [bacterium]|nr:DMT family transporter [bacterium]
MTHLYKSYFYAMLATLLWSTVATAFKLGLQYFHHDSSALLGWSTFWSVLFLLAAAIFCREKEHLKVLSRQAIYRSALLGLLNPFLYYLVLFKAYDLLPASEAQPLNYTWPITLSIFSSIIFKQRLHMRHIVALGCGLFGVLVISTRGHFGFHFSHTTGMLLAVGSSVIWAVYWIGNMHEDRPALQKMRMNFIFGFCYLFLYLFFRNNIYLPSYSGMICAIWIGLGEMGLTFVLWMRALELAPSAGSISHVVYLSPFLSLIFLKLILKEHILISSVIGLCLIIGGVLIGSLRLRNMTKN